MHIIDAVLTDTEKAASGEGSGGIRGISVRGVIAVVIAAAGAIYVAM